MNTLKMQRVLTDKQAAEYKNKRVAEHQPTALPDLKDGPVLLEDTDTGAPIAYLTRMPDKNLQQVRAAIMEYRAKFGNVYRSGGMASKTAPFGYLAPAPQLQRIAPTASGWAVQHSHSHDAVAGFAATAADLFTQGGPPAPLAANTEARENIHPDWRMGDTCWTSGVTNDTAGLYYHYDRNNTPETWSAMTVIRAGTQGGHFHIAEYDATLPCKDGDLYFFPAMKMMHGVTPIRKTLKNGYRFTSVYYSVRKFQGLPGAEESMKNALGRRAELETDLLQRQRDAGLIK
jgi:hypothetical protein